MPIQISKMVRRLFFLSVAFLFLSACREKSGVEGAESQGFFSPSALWNNGTASTCFWDSPLASNEIRYAVKHQWRSVRQFSL